MIEENLPLVHAGSEDAPEIDGCPRDFPGIAHLATGVKGLT